MGSMRYLTPGPVQRALRLYPLGAGRQQGQVPWVRSRAIGCYAAVLVASGSGSYRGAATTGVHGPAMIWVHPGAVHGYGPDRGGWAEQWILFDGPSIAPYRDLGLLDPDCPVQPLDDPGPVSELIGAAVEAVLSDDPRRLAEVTGLLHLLIARFSPRRMISSAAAALVREVGALALTPISVATLAERLGVTELQLRESVRTETGMSTKDYILTRRVERAQLLLARTDLTVAAIAREVGYDDAGYFTRVFTRRTGSAPSTFRSRTGRSR